MAKTVVNTDRLRSAGAQMGDLANQFQSEYKALLESAQNTKQGWNGADNDAFVSKISSLEDDFNRLYQLLLGCSNDLKESADTYDNNVQTVAGLANSLASSI